MAYGHKKWVFLNSIEHEYSYMGNYGAKGEKREKRDKPTPEQVEKQNQRNRENYVRRLIKKNFRPGDYWITLKYNKGTRKSVDEVKKDMQRFIANMRNAYKRQKEEFKYIYRVEIGSRGGIHIHIIMNRNRGKPNTDVLVDRYWKGGHPHYALLYEDGDYRQLASYLVKPQIDDQEPDEYLKRYHPSKNLIKPVPETKSYLKWTVKKLIEDGPTPQEGFYIDRDTLVSGVNPYTGMSYLHYTEVRIKPIRGSDSG